MLAAKCEERIITLIDTELHVLRHSSLCYHIKTSTHGGLAPNIEGEYPVLLTPQTDPDTLKAGEIHRRGRDITRRVSLAGGISP